MSGDNVMEAWSLFQTTSSSSSLASPHQNRELTYDKNHCWQYDVRLLNRQEDLLMSGLTEEYIRQLTVKDFTFKIVTDPIERQRMIAFIKRHEWLGTVAQFTTHWFACYHKRHLAGVVLMGMPTAFSKLLGDDTKKLERLISRGACISWSPPNLASTFIAWCIRYMVKTTDFRLFTAYSDPTARELGTIYQACNFYYLGQGSGTTRRYINPYTGRLVSDRFFRARSAYKRYAKDMGIEWDRSWNDDQMMRWANMPPEVEARLRERSKLMQKNAVAVPSPAKHKYAYVLGQTKLETFALRTLFEVRNMPKPYPKQR